MKRALSSGIRNLCADDIVEGLCNLEDGTCDDLSLIPQLEEIAKIDMFYYFDDNSAGGFPRPSGEPSSFRDWALGAIENIKENKSFVANSKVATGLKSGDTQTIKQTLRQIAHGNLVDETLIPILEKIARKDEYRAYSYFKGFHGSRKFRQLAEMAIQRIKDNVTASKQPATDTIK